MIELHFHLHHAQTTLLVSLFLSTADCCQHCWVRRHCPLESVRRGGHGIQQLCVCRECEGEMICQLLIMRQLFPSLAHYLSTQITHLISTYSDSSLTQCLLKGARHGQETCLCRLATFRCATNDVETYLIKERCNNKAAQLFPNENHVGELFIHTSTFIYDR